MGAWGEKAFDCDTGAEWLAQTANQVRLMLLDAGMWSRYQEAGIAAAALLVELPPVLRDELGSSPFAEGLEIVETELAPEIIKGWKFPEKRRRYLLCLKLLLQVGYKHQMKLEATYRKRRSLAFAAFKPGGRPKKRSGLRRKRVANPKK